ncbi:MAG TPA: hypothetical protein VGN09_14795 [Vicinamibacteria bacterium]
MARRTTMVAAALTALALGACGGSNTTTSPTASPTPTTAPVITIVTDPSPAPITASTDPAFEWETSFSLTLTESAGVAVNIRSISANLQQAAGGIVVTPPTGLAEAFRYEVRSPSNRIAANGTITIAFTFLYTLPQPGQEALVTVTLNLYDDSGSAHPQTVQVKVV